MIDLRLGDCLEIMKSIPDKSIDLVLTDPPYGTTACKWDTVIPFEPMWKELKRISKSSIVLFAKQPFTSTLICSNVFDFQEHLLWQKSNHDNPMMAKRKHMNITEDVIVFRSKKNKLCYSPQGLQKLGKETKQGTKVSLANQSPKKKSYFQEYTNYPKNILKFKNDKPSIHPTQKPVSLLEYLIKTYTLENETVLDFTMGSGSTGVACKNLNRNFIGIEKDENYFEIAKNRIEGIK